MKDQLSDIESEKSNISEKISELTKSLGQTNLIKNPFKKNKDINEIKSKKRQEIKEINIDEEIKSIFQKK